MKSTLTTSILTIAALAAFTMPVLADTFVAESSLETRANGSIVVATLAGGELVELASRAGSADPYLGTVVIDGKIFSVYGLAGRMNAGPIYIVET